LPLLKFQPSYLILKLIMVVGGCHYDDSYRNPINLPTSPEMFCRRTSRLVCSCCHALTGILPIRNSVGKSDITRAHIRGSTQSTGHDIVRNLKAVLVILLSISDSSAMTSFCPSNSLLSVQYGSSSLEARTAALSYTYSIEQSPS